MPLYCPVNLTPWEWLVQRFWAKVQKGGEDECWPWLGAKVTDGYGTIAMSAGEPWATHRLSYRIHNKGIPRGAVVRHTCDNRACCNPKHLVCGTNWDNVADRIKRHTSGKLTATDIETIRTSAEKQWVVAKRFGVSQSMVSRIKRGNRWGEEMLEAFKRT